MKDCSTDEVLLTPFRKLNLKEDQIWVYVHWLMALGNGPKWLKMDRQEVIENTKKLRTWIVDDFPKLFEFVLSDSDRITRQRNYISMQNFIYRLELIPNELIHIAGFSGMTPSESPGNWDDVQRRLKALKIGKGKMEAASLTTPSSILPYTPG